MMMMTTMESAEDFFFFLNNPTQIVIENRKEEEEKRSLGGTRTSHLALQQIEEQSQNQLLLSFYPTMPLRSETLTFPDR